MTEAEFHALEVPALTVDSRYPPSEGELQERRVVVALLVFLKKRGFAPMSVDDGGDERIAVATIADVLDAVFAVEEALLYVKGASGRYGISLVRGNSPYELICDHGAPHPDPDAFVGAMGQFCDLLMALDDARVADMDAVLNAVGSA